MALISKQDDIKDFRERQANGGKRPNGNDNALGCMFHLNRNCGCPRCRNINLKTTTLQAKHKLEQLK